MKSANWIFTHRRSILFLLFLVTLAGIVTSFKLPVTLFPNIQFPRILINLEAGDMPADQMALQVTAPVEQAVRQVPGVLNVRSTTSRGSASVSINFDWGGDLNLSALQINAALSQIVSTLPMGTNFATQIMDPTKFPMLSYSLTSDTESLTQLRDLALYQLVPLLSGVTGVAKIGISGGEQLEYQVLINPLRLKAYNLSFTDIVTALGAANTVSAVGRVEDHYQLYLVISDNSLENLSDIQETVLKANNRGLIRLKDIATVKEGVAPQWVRVTADGHNAVLLNVFQQPGSNSVLLAKRLKEKLAAFMPSIPADIKIANWYDQSELVLQSADSVRDSILMGILLAAMVLFLFLRHVKVTLIAVIVVPAVLASTLVLLMLFNMSFNIMTLGGMAAAVGLIIDDAIVMLEHIIRRLQGSHSMNNEKSVLGAAFEFFKPLMGSSAATIVIFIPLAFLSGVTGAFFQALSLTMAASLVISFLMTWLAVPLLAHHWLKEKDYEEKPMGKNMRWLQAHYQSLMRIFLQHPVRSLSLIIVPLILLAVLAYSQVGSGFMPSMDEGGFVLDYKSNPGTSLTETDRLLQQVETIIKENPNVATYSRRTGNQLGGGITEANEGDFFIRLKPFPRQAIDEVIDDIRTQVTEKVPGLDIDFAQLMEDLIGDLTAVPQPIEIKLFAKDPAELPGLADKIASSLANIKGVVDIKNGINPAGSALQIKVDPVKAAAEGINADQVTQQLKGYLTGIFATQLADEVKVQNVRVSLPQENYNTEEKLSQLLLTAPDGHIFPLQRVATIIVEKGQAQITHENLKPMVAVVARISGRDLGSVMQEVKGMMSEAGRLPSGAYYELGGLYEQQQIAFQGLMLVLIAAFALVFLLLLFLYENFRIALSIIVIPLLSMSGVFLGLWITHTELNISSMMGMTMVVGIVTEVAIFYFSEYTSLRKKYDHIDALVLAGQNRMRPIIMTTLAAILTLLPLALALGSGSEMQQPLAISIISGLLMQVPLTLLLMPVLFDQLFKKVSNKSTSNQ